MKADILLIRLCNCSASLRASTTQMWFMGARQMQPFDGDGQWLLYPGVNSTVHSWAAWQSRERRFLMWRNSHNPHHQTACLNLALHFSRETKPRPARTCPLHVSKKGQHWQNGGKKNCFPVEENACVNYFRYVTEYSTAFARSSVIWMCVCVLCGSPWPLLQAVPCPGHESSTGKNVLSDSMPPNTPKHTASS